MAAALAVQVEPAMARTAWVVAMGAPMAVAVEVLAFPEGRLEGTAASAVEDMAAASTVAVMEGD